MNKQEKLQELNECEIAWSKFYSAANRILDKQDLDKSTKPIFSIIQLRRQEIEKEE